MSDQRKSNPDIDHSRSQLHDCALFPQNPRYRQTYVQEIRTANIQDNANMQERFTEETKKLVDMFPDGLEGWLAEQEAQGEISVGAREG